MKAQASAAALLSAGLPSSGVRVLMLYEDLGAANRVTRLFASLWDHCGVEVTFHSDMWKIDTLRAAGIRKLAAQDAQAADVIIVATHDGDELPAELEAWFQAWVPHRLGRPGVLVSLLDRERGSVPEFDSACLHLQEMARRAGLNHISMSAEREETDTPSRFLPGPAAEPPLALENFCRRIARAGRPARVPVGA